MALQDWADGVLGHTPLTAERLNIRDQILASANVQLSRDPSALFTGPITSDANGAPTSASVTWPDGVTGTYSGTPSTTFPGAVDSYTITRATSPVSTYTQPAVTRDTKGNITNRPAITVT